LRRSRQDLCLPQTSNTPAGSPVQQEDGFRGQRMVERTRPGRQSMKRSRRSSRAFVACGRASNKRFRSSATPRQPLPVNEVDKFRSNQACITLRQDDRDSRPKRSAVVTLESVHRFAIATFSSMARCALGPLVGGVRTSVRGRGAPKSDERAMATTQPK
jgi:hypothetical protein